MTFLYWHGEDRDVLMLLRMSVLTGERANYSQIMTKRSLPFHSIYDYLALLKAFNIKPLFFINDLIDKLSSHQPSHMHNIHYLIIQKLKNFICTYSHIWNSLPSSLKNCTSKFTFKKQIKIHLLASQS